MNALSEMNTFTAAEAALHAAAIAEAGYDDFGDPSYRDNLRAYLKALDDSGRITPVGRQILFGSIVAHLRSRLYTQAGLKANPEVLERAIQKPVFILGLPRTGTTVLQNLLAADPQFQGLQLWLAQSPMPRPPADTWHSHPEFQRAQAGVDAMYAAVPELKGMHWMAADEVDECRAVLSHCFTNASFGWPNDLDNYLQWLYRHDMTPEYRYFANVLRLIGKHEPEKTWVLKCPTHSICTDQLLNVFPDARLVFMHRDPAAVVPSISSMVYKLRGLTEGDATRPERCGQQMLDNLDYAMRRLLEVRAQHPENFLDVRYNDFIADPIKGVQAVYTRFDIPFTPATETGIEGWLRDNPPGKHGGHRYTPEDFGLTAAGIRARFSYYSDY